MSARDDVTTYATTTEADTVLAAVIPEWEAVYEPGNVSDYLIGYANTEAAAKGAAIAWVLSQSDKTAGRLEWEPQNWSGEHDAWFDLFERHDDGVETGIGVTVRHRLHPYTAADFTPEDDAAPAAPAPSTCTTHAGDQIHCAHCQRTGHFGATGTTELTSDREIARIGATGIVGYRQNQGRLHHCLAHKPAPAFRYADFHEVGADDLDDGGICVHRDCGRDLLAAWPSGALSAPSADESLVCEWNPATASPACDHDPNCPVHGREAAKETK